MELTYVTIIVLAAMIFILSGMVGYMYWQQTRMLQHIQSLSMIYSARLVEESPESEPETEPPSEPEMEVEVPELTDDRLSVEDMVETVEGPPEVDDIMTKTAPQLRELLSAKGIPYGKRDSKAALLQLLKATM